MAHSLEARCPLLDHRVIELAAAQPAFRHGDKAITKRLFRDVIRPWVPADVLARPKRGFGVPLRSWFKDGMVGWAREILLDARSMQRGWTRGAEVRALLDQHEQGSRDHAKRIWALVSLELSAWRTIASRRVLPDVVHAHALHQAARLRRAFRPVVINLPGAPHPRYADDLRAADALVADGWAAEFLPAQLGCEIANVPKGVDAERFSPDGANRRSELGLQDRPIIIAVGRLVPIKRTALLLDALSLLRRRVPSAHLLVVGEGPERRALQKQAERLGVADNVTFT